MESSPDQAEPRQPKRLYRPVKYTKHYAHKDSPAFAARIHELYSLSEDAEQYRQAAQWAKCCKTVEKHHYSGKLGHPAAQCVQLRDLKRQEGLDSEEKFKEFMLNELSPDRKGIVLLPQINMRHPLAEQPQEENHSFFRSSNLSTREDEDSSYQLRQEEIEKINEKNEYLSLEMAELRNKLVQLKVASTDADRAGQLASHHQEAGRHKPAAEAGSPVHRAQVQSSCRRLQAAEAGRRAQKLRGRDLDQGRVC